MPACRWSIGNAFEKRIGGKKGGRWLVNGLGCLPLLVSLLVARRGRASASRTKLARKVDADAQGTCRPGASDLEP